MGAADDGRRDGERLFGRGVLVAPVEGLGRREGDVHLVEARLGETVVAAFVQDEARVHHPRLMVDAGHDLLGARHLRGHARVHEADRLDPRQAGGGQPVDQLGADLEQYVPVGDQVVIVKTYRVLISRRTELFDGSCQPCVSS